MRQRATAAATQIPDGLVHRAKGSVTTKVGEKHPAPRTADRSRVRPAGALVARLLRRSGIRSHPYLGGWVARAAAVAMIGIATRRWYLRWGAGGEEVRAAVTGDQLLSHADLTATRAITVQATAAQVWPWLAQLGQGRGGFYSYDGLENLVGCRIHSADRVVPQWQSTEVGDQVRLHPDMALLVAQVEPGRALVLRGGVPMGSSPAPYDFTWAFVLREGRGGTTRLVVRERYSYSRWWAALLVEPVELISAVMSQRMLRGIRDRASTGRVGSCDRQVDVTTRPRGTESARSTELSTRDPSRRGAPAPPTDAADKTKPDTGSNGHRPLRP